MLDVFSPHPSLRLLGVHRRRVEMRRVRESILKSTTNVHEHIFSICISIYVTVFYATTGPGGSKIEGRPARPTSGEQP